MQKFINNSDVFLTDWPTSPTAWLLNPQVIFILPAEKDIQPQDEIVAGINGGYYVVYIIDQVKEVKQSISKTTSNIITALVTRRLR